MPEEGEPHRRTWMGFGASQAIWGRKLLPEVRRNLATIANTIIEYEPVTMLVRAHERKLAASLLDPRIELLNSEIDDLWLRDTGPTFVANADQVATIDFNFNGWGRKQAHRHDAKIARFIANKSGVKTLSTNLVLEGGCFEVDGHGTAIITESCVLNKNRNPGVSKAEFEDRLMPLLGLDKIIWLPGIAGKDITDGHTDFYARFAKPGTVIAGYDPDPYSYDHDVTLEHLEILSSARDAQGNLLKVEILEAPTDISKRYGGNDFAAGYIGYYACNDAIILQSFGDKTADRKAHETLQKLFPHRAIEAIRIDGIAAGGGSVHCATQQQPLFADAQ